MSFILRARMIFANKGDFYEKYTILFTGLLAVILVGLMLGSTACEMPRWQYAGNMLPGKLHLAGEDLAYG
ncbi:MAG: hypothetical protein R2875_04580 [Desulfobacterales bacterium]